jgi:phosphomannomutase
VEAERARLDALVGVGHDGGYAFRGVAAVDAALVAARHVLAVLGGQPHALSDLTELYEPYATGGPIDLGVPDADAALARVARAYVTDRGAGPVEHNERDGLTVSHWAEAPRWWFTLRAGPVAGDLRLVVEAADEDIMAKVRDDVIALARNDGETSR